MGGSRLLSYYRRQVTRQEKGNSDLRERVREWERERRGGTEAEGGIGRDAAMEFKKWGPPGKGEQGGNNKVK